RKPRTHWSLMNILVYVARHGETQLNAAHKFRGKNNVPLNSTGLKQAGVVRDKLSKVTFGQVISSDRERAIQTAEIICEGLDEGFDITPNLRAWDIGFLS